ncbi:ubiquitin-hydrolase Zn-finger-containing protein [Filimonas lacunae]|uniref:Ubiquitin-hydrolase Zn-finger-containing protein n=1 Tax=Filimonas lacunae TaxID=477680 RepID=A0A173MFM8_9BACT|nr:UBP-type zinc finger domain-containing protein [Filimonas lacunae]BAV06287.1 hypothetical protein FLA_2303 [Filimonas lacunae]SIT25667.1 ubiquitin-hydrolase Zn-finger-containing protein [Filimonas lacunae]
MSLCEHLIDIDNVTLSHTHVCEECAKTNSRWVHLRVCQTCGVTLCCDDSPNKHMTQHFHATGHPVIASGEPGERWLWCYKDEVFTEY